MDSCCMDRSCARWITEGWKLYHSMQLGLHRDGLQCHLPHRKHTGEGSADVADVDRAWVGLKGLKGPPNVDFGSFLNAKPTFLGTQFSDPSPKWFVFADRACLLKCHDWTRFKTWLQVPMRIMRLLCGITHLPVLEACNDQSDKWYCIQWWFSHQIWWFPIRMFEYQKASGPPQLWRPVRSMTDCSLKMGTVWFASVLNQTSPTSQSSPGILGCAHFGSLQEAHVTEPEWIASAKEALFLNPPRHFVIHHLWDLVDS